MKAENILFVDDEPEVLSALKLRLGRDYNIYTATDPGSGLQLIKEKGPFSVIVSDFRMPEMNGIDFLVAANQICPESASVLLTGQGEYNVAINALNSGKVFKFLSKPCETSEINKAIQEGIKFFNSEVKKKHALREYDNENRVAKIVQDQLLFTKLKPVNENIELTALSTPKSNVCGDFYEIISHSKECFDVMIADVMGKGLPAAIIGAAIKNSVMHHIHALRSNRNNLPSISEILSSVEKETFKSLVEARMFLTILYARINLKNRSISYISHGHPGAIIIRQNSFETVYLHSTDMPMGITKRDFFKQINLKLLPGDKFIFYTDGISEALVEGPDDEPVELILNCLDGSEDSTDAIAAKIFEQAKLKRGVEDDMTIISMNLSKTLHCHEPVSFFLTKDLNEIYRLNGIVANSSGNCDELFNVAVIETFTNIVKHSGERDTSIKLIANVNEDGRKVFEFVYEGQPFQPQSIKIPDCETQSNGFGLFLVENICDSAYYEKNENGRLLIRLVSK